MVDRELKRKVMVEVFNVNMMDECVCKMVQVRYFFKPEYEDRKSVV